MTDREMLEMLVEGQKQIFLRLDGVDSRLDGVDSRLDGIDNRLDGIDNRLDGIDAVSYTHLADHSCGSCASWASGCRTW